MNNTTYNIKIENEKFGVLVNESFVDLKQYKLFLKMVHGCLELKNDLTFFNGVDCLIHVPIRFLLDSLVLTSTSQYTLADHAKSKIEALVTK